MHIMLLLLLIVAALSVSTVGAGGSSWSLFHLPPSPMVDPERCGRPGVATSAVCDPDLMLSKEDKDAIEGRINLQFKDGIAEMAVLVVRDISMWSSADSFARKVHDSWGVGNKDTNNGMLLFLSINDRDIYISIGKGIPLGDSDLDYVIESMKPLCKEHKYGTAVELGLSQLSTLLKNPDSRVNNSSRAFIVISVFAFVFAGIVCYSSYRKRQDNDHSSELREGNRRMANLMKEIKENDVDNAGVYMSSSCPICLEDFPSGIGSSSSSNNNINSGIDQVLPTGAISTTTAASSAPGGEGLEMMGMNQSKSIGAVDSFVSNLSPSRPMCLQCGHVFCHSCLTGLFASASRSHTIALCPICRAPCETASDNNSSTSSINNNDDARIPLMSRTHGNFRQNRRMEYLYRARRIYERYPRSMDAHTLNSLVNALDNGDLFQATTLLRERQIVNSTTITDIATRQTAISSGSHGSKSKSFGGGRSSRGRGGKW